MRIWHESLIPKLCVKHLVAMWRESLGAYAIITQGKKGYRSHPATQEFVECPEQLHDVLVQLYLESVKRGYKFKDIPDHVAYYGSRKPWQSLNEQVVVLKAKQCSCMV